MAALRTWADDVLPSFGDAARAPEVLSALERALEEAVMMGVYTGGRAGPASEQQELLRQARKYAWSTLDNVRAVLDKAAGDRLTRLREAAHDRGRSMAPIQHLARTAHLWLDGSTARVEARLQDEAPRGGLELVDLLMGVEQVMQVLGAPGEAGKGSDATRGPEAAGPHSDPGDEGTDGDRR